MTLRATLFITLLCCLALPNMAQIAAGPMPGYSTMREVAVWVQTEAAAEVSMRYWTKGSEEKTSSTPTVNTTEQDAFTAHLVATEVEPGTTYEYEILVNNATVPMERALEFKTQPLWQWRSDPPGFSFAVGSCSYINETKYDRPGTPYGGQYEIFETIEKREPEFMLWLGDNTYLREADWNSRSGIMKRYTHTRQTKEMQGLLSSCHHYAIWDDHDFGPNNSDRSFVNKDWSLEAFKRFWANNRYGINGKPGITTKFSWNDVDFFLLDNRYYRTPLYKYGESTILGEEQVEWLIDALKASQAPFKMVAIGGQFLNTAAIGENHVLYARERETIISRIAQEQIHGVVFLTGDRHHSELSKLDMGNGIVIYDLTASPLTSGMHSVEGEQNGFRVDKTLVEERNFALLEVSGPRTRRKLTINLINSEGKELWDYTIKAY